MSAFQKETVLSVRHWTESLFSFTATRDPGFRFQNGQFAMIGLEVEGKPLMRAYSMASANHEEALEFFSIKVQDGPLTSRLQKIREGDTILVGRKATGTLIADNLIPGKRLLLLSTGTGLAPFASLIKDPDVYDRYDSIVLVHGCRQVSELAYGEELVARLRDDELFGPLLSEKLQYYPTVTREPFRNRGRITDLINSGKLSGSESAKFSEGLVGIYMRAQHDFLTGFFTDHVDIEDHAVFAFEPLPTLTCASGAHP